MAWGRGVLGTMVAAALVLPSAALARDDRYDRYGHRYRHDDGGGAAVAAVLGLAVVGIAAAAASKRDRDDRRDWGDAYSPERDVTCYRQQHQCFWRDQFSPDWTDSQFGYDPYNRGY